MSTEELLELDVWIAEEIFHLGSTVGLMKRGLFYRPNASGYTSLASEAGKYTLEEAKKHECVRGEQDDVTIVRWEAPRYTTDPAAAMMVLEKCLNKAEYTNCIYLGEVDGEYMIGHTQLEIEETADTLPLAICLFAKELFKK